MGHRANYAIREDGEVELFYSHWGGLSAPQDVFWGPEAAEAFIRENERVEDDAWLDDVWGEAWPSTRTPTRSRCLRSPSSPTRRLGRCSPS